MTEKPCVIAFDNRDDLSFLLREIPDSLYVRAEELPVNPFMADSGVPFKTNLLYVISILGQYLCLLVRIMNVLYSAATKLHDAGNIVTGPRLHNFLIKNKGLFALNYEAWKSAIDRMEGLNAVFQGWNTDSGLTTPDLLKHRFILIDTSNLGRSDLRVVYIALICLRFWLWLRANPSDSQNTRVLVAVDEAEFLFHRNLANSGHQFSSHFFQDILRR